MPTITHYYGKHGAYLEDHAEYLTAKNLKRDTEFVIRSLKLTKRDSVLDVQCAQGRITVELAQKGFDVDGVDASGYMIDLAKQAADERGLAIYFFKQDLMKLKLRKKYSKVFMIFPDWSDVDFEKILPNIANQMKKGGLFLYDHDNLYRLWRYLETNPKKKSNFTFDPSAMTLKEKDDKTGDRYYTLPELKRIFANNGFTIERAYGDWEFNKAPYGMKSARMRVVARKK